ncbi:MAG: undecaprenyl-diphosphate phosphatase [Nanoarchaeota archaeon]|nr:undecaprenyl-diphosphate phosphatase [Nanoarchaeota archaeon]
MIELLISGIIQGILEWLPVSSEGFVSLFLQNAGYTFEQAVDVALFLHIGTLAATISYFWTDFKKMVSPKTTNQMNLLIFFLWTTLFSVLIAGPLYLFIQTISVNFADKVGLIIGSLLVITGLLQLFRKNFGSRAEKSVKKIDGIITGLAQGAAVLPGISRSGSTTLALLIQGFNINSALKLSFLASIPVIFIAQLVSGLKNGFYLNIGYLLAGLTAFIVGRLTIQYLLKVAEKVNFSIFCIIFGLIAIIF